MAGSGILQLLVVYNNNDAKPFISTAKLMLSEYFAQGLDIFKLSVSCSGIARIKLMQYARGQDVHFTLFNQAYTDLYHLF